jgi:hypothetical protein
VEEVEEVGYRGAVVVCINGAPLGVDGALFACGQLEIMLVGLHEAPHTPSLLANSHGA